MTELILQDKTYRIIGLCMKVHSVLRCGFKEVIYKDALEVEFRNENIKYEREKRFTIEYNGEIPKHCFIADFTAYEETIIEAKSVSDFHYSNFQQTLNYLKASKIHLGWLINFGTSSI